MESFDEVVADPEVKLTDIRTFLAGLDGCHLFRDRHWVAQTSGVQGAPMPANENGRVLRRERLGGLLNYYHRDAA